MTAPVPENLVTIELPDGKVRPMMLTLGDARKLRDDIGVDLFDDKADVQELGVEAIVVLLYKMLRHGDPELTEEQLFDLVHVGNIRYVIGQVGKVFAEAKPPDPLPEAEPEKEKTTIPISENRTAEPTGSDSGPSVSLTSG